MNTRSDPDPDPDLDPDSEARRVPARLLFERRARLLELARSRGVSEVLVTHAEHVYYLFGLRSTEPTYALLTEGCAVVVAASDAEDLESITDQGVELATFVAYQSDRLPDPQLASERALTEVLDLRVGRRIGCDRATGPSTVAADGRVVIDLSAEFARARRPRDSWEIAQLRQRVSIVEAGLRAAAGAVVAGNTELDVYAASANAIDVKVNGPEFVPHAIGSGPRSALPAPIASGRRLTQGDLVLVDIYPNLGGYTADLTRTWTVGRPTATAEFLHDAAQSALRAAEGLLGPGVATANIDAVVRAALRSHGGLDEAMAHHSGHGIGIRAWEDPWIAHESAGFLEVGDVIAVEPGAYRRGIGGVRLEGNYLITSKGFDRLDTYSEGLIS